jgi:flagellar protein FliO/FliZ
MKHGPFLTLVLAAALAAAPAMAQRSVSGTIGGAHAAAPAASASAPAADAGPVPTAEPPAAAAPAVTPAPAATTTPAGPLAMTIPTPPPAAPSTGGLLQTIFALIFVLALLIGAAWALKRFGPKNFGGGNSNVKLVGALSVGARERILVVEVGEQWIVVGASPGRMNALATMPRQESAEAAVHAPLPTANFAAWLKQTIDKRDGK